MGPESDISRGIDLERLRVGSCVQHAEQYTEIDSTNDRALWLGAEPDTRIPAIVIAERQTCGRGRGKNRWWTSSGGLAFSLVVALDVSRTPYPPTSLVAGLAVAETLRRALPSAGIQVKWPNDVMLKSRKVCGILVERANSAPGRCVIGIGLNVNNRVAAAPAELKRIATSMSDVAGRSFDLTTVLIDLLNHLEASLIWMQSPEFALVDRWNQYCFLTGRFVEVQSGNRKLAGQCAGVDDTGALLLHQNGDTERCYAGVITSIR